MFILLLITLIRADWFVASNQEQIDVFQIDINTCTKMNTIFKSCNKSFQTDEMTVTYLQDSFQINITNDTNTYGIYNPYNNMPNLIKKFHFINTVYTTNNFNTAQVNTSYDVLDVYGTFMYTISEEPYTMCMSQYIQYDTGFVITKGVNSVISDYIPVIHVIIYFNQETCNVKNNSVLIAVLIVLACVVSTMIGLCMCYVYHERKKKRLLQEQEYTTMVQ